MSQYDGWIQARVGCHWSRGDFHASTISGPGGSGYILTRNREVLAEYVPWAEIARMVAEYEARESRLPPITPSEPPSIARLIAERESDVRNGRLIQE